MRTLPQAIQTPLLAAATLAATAAVALCPTPADAQARWSRVSQRAEQPASDRGWIGISFEVVADDWGRARRIVVADVATGSPAHEAGIQAGDQLLAINDLDEAGELAELTRRLSIRVGDPVVLEVARRGDLHQVRLTAAPRPADVRLGESVEVTVAPERVREWVRSMDSLRVEIERGQGARAVTVRATNGGQFSQRITIVSNGARNSVAAPFEFHLFRGEEYDSLSEEMTELNRVMSDLQTRLDQRQSVLERRLGERDPLSASQDGEVRRLVTMLSEVSGRSAELEASMAQAALSTAGSEYLSWAPQDRSPVAAPAAPSSSGEFRPLSPYLIGRNRIAGAEVIDIKPELASYFQVERGVLITDVTEGTPSAMAGIIPGDVITGVGDMSIRSVEDLRFAVSMSGDSIPLLVVRQGTERPVTLWRR